MSYQVSQIRDELSAKEKALIDTLTLLREQLAQEKNEKEELINALAANNKEGRLAEEMAEMKREIEKLKNSTILNLNAQVRRGKPFATTRLLAHANSGSSELECNVPVGSLPGMVVVIGDGYDNEEERQISGFASILIDHPLSHAHPVGTIVTIYDPNQLALALYSKGAEPLRKLQAESAEKDDNIALAKESDAARQEIEDLRQQLNKVSIENTALSKKCGDIQASGLAAKAARDKLILELETKLASQSKDAELLRKLQAESAEKGDNIALLTAKIGEIENQIETYRTMAAAANAGESDAARQEIEDLRQQLNKVSIENTALSKKCGDIQASGLAAKAARDKLILELETKLASQSKDAELLRKLQAESAEKDDNIALLTAKIGDIEKQIVSMAMVKADAIDARREIEALTQQLHFLKQQHEFLKQQLDKASEENKRMAAQSMMNKDEIASLHEHLDAANQRLDAQMKENSRLAATNSEIRKVEAEATLEEQRRISDLESRHMVSLQQSIHSVALSPPLTIISL